MNTQLIRHRRLFQFAVCILVSSLFMGPPAFGLTLEELAARMEALEAENRVLREKVAELETGEDSVIETRFITAAEGRGEFLSFNRRFSYEMLDPTTRINRKQQLILEKKQSGELAPDSLVLGGAVTAIANVQRSNTDSKFGWLMRHPTSNNQVTKEVSEAVIHSAQLSLTANFGSWVTAYSEILYDPEQSFGAGTTTALSRNQLQLRRGYVLFGNLDESPLYLSLGKMATPFGLTDTVNPFTANTVWHVFGGLAYGVQTGYIKDGLNLTLMGVQGGAQFRAHNTPVDDTATPSKLNNYVVDGNYTFELGEEDHTLLLGASYQKGSAYCQGFPITHFGAGEDYNPAIDVYSKLTLNNLLVHAEYGETRDDWPGTFNPLIPAFPAHEVIAFNVGSKYTANIDGRDFDFSADFSRFNAGPDGAPWENQDQLVLGVATFVTPSVKLFAEYIRTSGYAPLNFISGDVDPGAFPAGETHSDNSARSDVLVLGVNAAF
ncbi:MAG: hypothetical protein QF541_07275 [Lentisphaeria bacterium]|nr:hypothetical protein [Lentisphaeria bacterium]